MTETDILEYRHADDGDRAIMDRCPRYDYVRQTWTTGHDHAHLEYDPELGETADDSELLFCRAASVSECADA
ncbi:MAG: hypothetical protein GY773_00915 [Actinomycetia bacterium]|nr:hypothetical protein [Actinomycetes bacterium]